MQSIKSYSDLKQSKELAKILPLESADMYYKAVYRLDKPEEILEYTPRPIIGSILKTVEHRNLMRSFTLETKTYKMKDIGIPCWSLAALLGILQKTTYSIDKDANVMLFSYKTVEWDLGIDNSDLKSITESNPVDACYEMILKLHELKML